MEELVDADKKEYRQILGEILDEIKELAKDLKIPVILTMTLPDSDDESLPSLCDLKKYMIIPQKADKVIFIHRERLKQPCDFVPGRLIVAKNDEGGTGDVGLSYYPVTESFLRLYVV